MECGRIVENGVDDRNLKILMLGWEFPPHISGGLGTACQGLTKALAEKGTFIHFLMPRLHGDEEADFLQIYDLAQGSSKPGNGFPLLRRGAEGPACTLPEAVSIYEIPSFLKPYLHPDLVATFNGQAKIGGLGELQAVPFASGAAMPQGSAMGTAHYGTQLFQEVQAYARKALALSGGLHYQLIHAHDWMTFPAAIAIRRSSGRPAILHVHSLESDRSGGCRNEIIAEIERSALLEADAIIAVSDFTRQKIVEDYGVSHGKIFVVHNGINATGYKRREFSTGKKAQTVLFLGRVTFQKGPDYFVEAAINVLQVLPETKFVIAGSGDMLEPLARRIEASGFSSSFQMPGFLRGAQVEKVFEEADLYVMPSVSEPFGISALEALHNDVPIIISRQSGVSEVIQHALKADFWDIDELADLMIGALKYPELRRDLLQMARMEVSELGWNRSAGKTLEVYRLMLGWQNEGGT